VPLNSNNSQNNGQYEGKESNGSVGNKLPHRAVRRIERCDRIPTWPASNGLRCRAVARLFPGRRGAEMAAKLEHRIGGADCPNIWLANDDTGGGDGSSSPSAMDTSPFLMLVHHNHSFDLADPARLLQSQLVPEGFPSHAHRGMTTVTICLRGGLVHRDSQGTKQVFGAETEAAAGKGRGEGPYKGKHTQWLTFGRGIVHELMFDNVRRRGQRGHRGPSVLHQELYQIWIDLPRAHRLMEPRVELLGGTDETPTVRRSGTVTTVIAGRHDEATARVGLTSDLTIVRVEMGKHTVWRHRTASDHRTAIAYVRTGSIQVGSDTIPAHCTAHFTKGGDLTIVAGREGADFLFLSGEPLGQNVVARGSMVAETSEELGKAFTDYENGDMGTPWSERCNDAEWRLHVAKHKR
jgi:redox-sensitive bicupin YhaK (pirin superfamily)